MLGPHAATSDVTATTPSTFAIVFVIRAFLQWFKSQKPARYTISRDTTVRAGRVISPIFAKPVRERKAEHREPVLLGTSRATTALGPHAGGRETLRCPTGEALAAVCPIR